MEIEKIKLMLNDLSEVELFFTYQDIDKQIKNGKNTEQLQSMLDHIIKLTEKFGVKNITRFMKWVAFWRKWQAELTIVEIRDMVDNISFAKAYEQYLPKKKWNERNKR